MQRVLESDVARVLHGTHTEQLELRFKCSLILDRFPAKLGPKSPLNESGSNNGANQIKINPGDQFQSHFVTIV